MFKKRTTLIFIFSIIVVILASGTLILFFKLIENKNEHTSTVLATLADKIEKKENAKVLEEKIKEVDAIKDTIDSYFVNPKDIDSFIAYLENLGNIAGSLVKVESFDSSTNNQLSVKITLKGNFSNVMRTLMMLENSPYRIHVQKTSLTHEEGFSTPDPKNPTKQVVSSSSWKSEILFNVLLSAQ
jgi:hypothetical protein